MNTYPRASVIWPGAILGTIVNSIATAVDPAFDTLQSWSGNNYVVQGWDGRYAAITFQGTQGHLFKAQESSVVGAFYSAKSSQCPRVGEECHTAIETVFRGCPDHHRRLAETGALQFLLFEAHPRGPCATTAFWNTGDCLSAADSWNVVLENGADVIRIQLIEDAEEALAAWRAEYDLSETLIDLGRSIYRRKMNEPEKEIRLTDFETALLASLSTDPSAFQSCKVSFADIQIVVG